MALKNIITRGVNTAFKAAGDLVVQVTFTAKEAVSYNFNTGKANKRQSATTVIDGILLTAEKQSEDGNRSTDMLILKAAEAPSFDIYDDILIGTKKYRIESYSNSGYHIEVMVSGG